MSHKEEEFKEGIIEKYGWLFAILIILALIVWFGYTGDIFSTIVSKEYCTLQSNLYCNNQIIESGNNGGISFSIQNTQLSDIILEELIISKNDKVLCRKEFSEPYSDSEAPFLVTIPASKSTTIKIPSSTSSNFEGNIYSETANYCDQSLLGTVGTKQVLNIELKYHEATKTSYQHTVYGKILSSNK